MDHTENKFYIGTHAGLFVWDRNNNTSQVYNTENSLAIHNLVNNISKNEASNLINVSFELGGMLTINTATGEQKHYSQDQGSHTSPQLMGTNIASTYFDEVEKKLYASIDLPLGGVWIQDYDNLVPDYGDLRLGDGSPALDIANQTFLNSSYTVDILGLPRLVDYSSINGSNSLDVGAHEKTFTCQPVAGDFVFDKVNQTVSFNPSVTGSETGCTISYSWNFGDGKTSIEANPIHTYTTVGTYEVSLQMNVSCGSCPNSIINTSSNVVLENPLCGSIYCDPAGRVSIATPNPAANFMLSVMGKAIAEGAKVVKQSAWPDYVFAPTISSLPYPISRIILKRITICLVCPMRRRSPRQA